MKLKEIAERLVVSKKTVYEWLRSGLIKGTLTKRPKGVGGHDIKRSPQTPWSSAEGLGRENI